MSNHKLAQNFALIALNAQDSLHLTMVKKIALRCMAAAVILELYIDQGFAVDNSRMILRNDILDQSQTISYHKTILNPLLKKGIKGDLKSWLKKASTLPDSKLLAFERVIADSLKADHLLEEIPNLLGCDLYYVTSSVKMKEYRADRREYTRITEGIRAEILEDGPVTEEAICLFWLLRESGCWSDLFSQNELEIVAARMNELYHGAALAKLIFPLRIRQGVRIACKNFMRWKRRVIATPLGTGLNFFFPILERSQSIFIDTETWFPNSNNIIGDLERRFVSLGHTFTVLQKGKSPLIKVNNTVFQVIPQAIVISRVPIHGLRLLPRRPF